MDHARSRPITCSGIGMWARCGHLRGGCPATVTAMPTHVCVVCDSVIPTHVAGVRSPVTISRRRNGHGETLRRIICQACASTYRAQSPDGRRRAGWTSEHREQVDCVMCGLPVLLPVDKRRKVDACSDLCRSRFYARPVEVVVTACDVCGSDMTGRSDLRFCSSPCRQRAYRRRLRSTSAARPASDERWRRRPRSPLSFG